MELRQYQERSLDALESYLRLAGTHGAKMAFLHQTERPYRAVPQLPVKAPKNIARNPGVVPASPRHGEDFPVEELAFGLRLALQRQILVPRLGL